MFEVVQLDDNEGIFVDEEGLLSVTPETPFFFYKGTHQPIAGNGLILGCNDDGESIATKLTVEQVTAKVKFMTLAQVQRF